MRTARNIGIIAVLAFGIAFLPGGGNVADAAWAAITIAFLAAITWAVSRLAGGYQTRLLGLPDTRRAVLYAGVGLVVLMIAGAGTMFRTGLGTLAWLALMASAGVAIWLVWSEAGEY